MALKCGIVGLPNVGKSTLFNCLSNAKAQSANFPFCTIEPNVGVISVPDDRLTRLVEMCSPRSVVPATVEIVDIAGLVKGASRGEGLGNKFLANIRETDAILHVLRCFDDDNITHVDGSVDPVRDKEIIEYELLLKDMETVDSRLARTIKQAQTGGDKTARMQADVLQSIKEALEQGKPARSVSFDTPDEQKFVRELFLLTSKPVLYVCNVDDASAATGNAYVDAVREAIASESALHVEPEVHYVAVLNHIFLAFHPEASGLAHGCFAAELHIIVVFDDLGADEAFFEVGVDDAGASRSLAAADKSPGTHLVGSGCEVGLQVEQGVGGAYEARHAAFGEAYRFDIMHFRFNV